jgi:hypothetical protein
MELVTRPVSPTNTPTWDDNSPPPTRFPTDTPIWNTHRRFWFDGGNDDLQRVGGSHVGGETVGSM